MSSKTLLDEGGESAAGYATLVTRPCSRHDVKDSKCRSTMLYSRRFSISTSASAQRAIAGSSAVYALAAFQAKLIGGNAYTTYAVTVLVQVDRGTVAAVAPYLEIEFPDSASILERIIAVGRIVTDLSGAKVYAIIRVWLQDFKVGARSTVS